MTFAPRWANLPAILLHLTKIAAVFATPLGVGLVVALLGLLLAWRGWRRLGHSCILVALLGLWAAAMPLTARLALGALEAAYPALPPGQSPAADVAIVLGGAVRGALPPRPGPDLAEASDRVLYAAELFRAGKVAKVVVTGGNLPWENASRPEAEVIASLLQSWGVPASRIVSLGSSRTTAENAAEVKAAWPSLGASSALLVTSAAHMPRALATFRSAGLPVTPAATDVRIVRQPTNLLDVLPSADALLQTSDAAKEAIGYFVYWLRGDI
ncbi:YdcF family protein [Aestuariivirga litoralis]|uniref:YdcF family protein n=1 Tax=Aestuariivirga litoralis TaxID=2650924 RepID=A0A2W2BRF3_9HYPH|nr:YdcF family protein [Aestuariivirga litoralis]